jgi:hypothetical protein
MQYPIAMPPLPGLSLLSSLLNVLAAPATLPFAQPVPSMPTMPPAEPAQAAFGMAPNEDDSMKPDFESTRTAVHLGA